MDYCLFVWLLQVTETYHIRVFLLQLIDIYQTYDEFAIDIHFY